MAKQRRCQRESDGGVSKRGGTSPSTITGDNQHTQVYRGADLDSDHRVVIVSVRPRLAKKRKQQQRKGFDAELLQQVDQRIEYLQSIRRSYEHRKGQGSVEERWNELKATIVRSAEQHLRTKREGTEGLDHNGDIGPSGGKEEGILKMAGTPNRWE